MQESLTSAKKSWLAIAAWIFVAAIIGLGCVVVPPYVGPDGVKKMYDAPLFPFIRTAWENLAFRPTMILMLVAGSIFGFIQPRLWWLLGPAAICLLPLAAILEMIVDPSSHNLWPVEFALYGVVGSPAVVGAFFASRARTWFQKRKTT